MLEKNCRFKKRELSAENSNMSTEASQLVQWLTLAREGDASAKNRLFAAGRSFAITEPGEG